MKIKSLNCQFISRFPLVTMEFKVVTFGGNRCSYKLVQTELKTWDSLRKKLILSPMYIKHRHTHTHTILTWLYEQLLGYKYSFVLSIK